MALLGALATQIDFDQVWSRSGKVQSGASAAGRTGPLCHLPGAWFAVAPVAGRTGAGCIDRQIRPTSSFFTTPSTMSCLPNWEFSVTAGPGPSQLPCSPLCSPGFHRFSTPGLRLVRVCTGGDQLLVRLSRTTARQRGLGTWRWAGAGPAGYRGPHFHGELSKNATPAWVPAAVVEMIEAFHDTMWPAS